MRSWSLEVPRGHDLRPKAACPCFARQEEAGKPRYLADRSLFLLGKLLEVVFHLEIRNSLLEPLRRRFSQEIMV